MQSPVQLTSKPFVSGFGSSVKNIPQFIVLIIQYCISISSRTSVIYIGKMAILHSSFVNVHYQDTRYLFQDIRIRS